MDLELAGIVINYGMATKFIKVLKREGLSGGTVVLGTGTAYQRIWSYLGLSDVRKEVLFCVGEKEKIRSALDKINLEFKLYKPHHGIAYTLPLCEAVGLNSCRQSGWTPAEKEEKGMYHVITTIVDKGKGNDVVEAANKAGSRGATILNGRGSGTHETAKLFLMEIEPEKEVVIIISAENLTQNIVESIRKALDIEKPGHGIIYVQQVSKTYGLYTEE